MDYNATTPLRPEVFEVMKPFLTERWGNPSSSYTFGSRLKAEIEGARRSVAQLVNANASEVIFTGSATESDNTAINAALSGQPGIGAENVDFFGSFVARDSADGVKNQVSNQ